MKVERIHELREHSYLHDTRGARKKDRVVTAEEAVIFERRNDDGAENDHSKDNQKPKDNNKDSKTDPTVTGVSVVA